jgi:hypothetical protein
VNQLLTLFMLLAAHPLLLGVAVLLTSSIIASRS